MGPTVTSPLMAGLSALSTDDCLVANIELDVAIRERAAGASFGHAPLKAGLTAVTLDDQGALVEFRPGGSRQPVDAARLSGQPDTRRPDRALARMTSPVRWAARATRLHIAQRCKQSHTMLRTAAAAPNPQPLQTDVRGRQREGLRVETTARPHHEMAVLLVIGIR